MSAYGSLNSTQGFGGSQPVGGGGSAGGGGLFGMYMQGNNSKLDPSASMVPNLYGLGWQAEQNKAQQAAETGRANIAAQASTLPARLAMERFGQVFPYLQSRLNQFGPNGGDASSSNSSPEITVGPVWNGQQVQQQVNQSRAANDAATQSQQRQMQQQLGGQGFGSGSPLAMALGAGMQNQNLQTNTQNETGIRNNASQVNAGQIFNTQQARSQQYAQRQSEALQAAQIRAGQGNALLSALAGLAG
jgi:hypothetical protein